MGPWDDGGGGDEGGIGWNESSTVVFTEAGKSEGMRMSKLKAHTTLLGERQC